ncbi:MAG TPA: guanylate kinase [Phycisphaerae bacterium]|nr:guanylate kinase [Phycisphaerae bacterium]HNU46505.1 guanylate kinase [Phycisphaerae bacterium]
MSSNAGAEPSRRRGRVIVISGPSGTGKTSICNALLRRLPGAVWSVSATTRPPRGGEISGQSYEFISPQEFERREVADEFLETAEYVGHRYGTPRRPVQDAVDQGQYVIMEIDVQGGIQVARKVPDAICIFVLPPDLESLRARLEGRRTEAQEQISRRLAKADGEIAVARDSGCYRYFVINDVLEATIAQVEQIIHAEQSHS